LLKDTEIIQVVKKLAEEEKNHQQRLFILCQSLDPSVTTHQILEAHLVSKVMEGGFTVEEFIEQNRFSAQNAQSFLNIAMMLETQALDLYMRSSDKCMNENVKEILFDLAEKEKQHLKQIGDLKERLC
jgi:rubrerythrin